MGQLWQKDSVLLLGMVVAGPEEKGPSCLVALGVLVPLLSASLGQGLPCLSLTGSLVSAALTVMWGILPVAGLPRV